MFTMSVYEIERWEKQKAQLEEMRNAWRRGTISPYEEERMIALERIVDDMFRREEVLAAAVSAIATGNVPSRADGDSGLPDHKTEESKLVHQMVDIKRETGFTETDDERMENDKLLWNQKIHRVWHRNRAMGRRLRRKTNT